jgi:hypothetical protein
LKVWGATFERVEGDYFVLGLQLLPFSPSARTRYCGHETPQQLSLRRRRDPVEHSLSPVMQNGWIADHGLDAVYVALPLRSADPVVAIGALTGFAGLNVTVPHKEAAAKAAARSEGAVANVLRREDDGSFSAFNTDGIDSFRSAPDWRARVRRADRRAARPHRPALSAL